MRIARRSADPFLRLLTATATLWVMGQVFINVGYVVGLLPVTGLQLPLISAGGTSTATTLLMIGIMANAARHEPEAVAALRAGREDRVNRLLRLPLPEPYVPTRTEALRDRLRSRRPAAAEPRARPRTQAGPQGRHGQRSANPIRPTGRCGAQGIMEAASERVSPAVKALASAIRAVGLAHWKVSVTGDIRSHGSTAIGGPRRWWHRGARRTRNGRGRRPDRARPGCADHRAGHRSAGWRPGWCPNAATTSN